MSFGGQRPAIIAGKVARPTRSASGPPRREHPPFAAWCFVSLTHLRIKRTFDRLVMSGYAPERRERRVRFSPNRATTMSPQTQGKVRVLFLAKGTSEALKVDEVKVLMSQEGVGGDDRSLFVRPSSSSSRRPCPMQQHT
jgi:hypothetical protein